MRRIAISAFTLLTLSLAFIGLSTALVDAQSTQATRVIEDKSIVFIIDGLTSMDDARITEELLMSIPGVIRSRTSYATNMSSVVTAKGYGVDSKKISQVLTDAGFTITKYNEYLIGTPKHQVKPQAVTNVPLQNSGDRTQQSEEQSKLQKERLNAALQKKLQAYEKLREDALKNGAHTELYDVHIARIKSELERE